MSSSKNAFEKLGESLKEFKKGASEIRDKLKGLYNDVLNVPYEASIKNSKGLRVLEKKSSDEFDSHLNYLMKMGDKLENADSNPVTLMKLHRNDGSALFYAKMARKQMLSFQSSELKKVSEQLQQLRGLAKIYKQHKVEEAEKADLGEVDSSKLSGAKERLLSWLKRYFEDEFRKALFESDLEANADLLLKHVEDLIDGLDFLDETAIKDVQALETIISEMQKIKGNKNQGEIIEYLSDAKEFTKKNVQ